MLGMFVLAFTLGLLSVSCAGPARISILTGTQTLGRKNDIYRTEDSGQTWAPVGLDFKGRIRSMLQSKSDPKRIYAIHTEGAVTSSDGGLTFTPISLKVNENDLPPVEVNLLATDPKDPNLIYAVHAGFPKTTVIRSNDGGTSWFGS